MRSVTDLEKLNQSEYNNTKWYSKKFRGDQQENIIQKFVGLIHIINRLQIQVFLSLKKHREFQDFVDGA